MIEVGLTLLGVFAITLTAHNMMLEAMFKDAASDSKIHPNLQRHESHIVYEQSSDSD